MRKSDKSDEIDKFRIKLERARNKNERENREKEKLSLYNLKNKINLEKKRQPSKKRLFFFY